MGPTRLKLDWLFGLFLDQQIAVLEKIASDCWLRLLIQGCLLSPLVFQVPIDYQKDPN